MSFHGLVRENMSGYGDSESYEEKAESPMLGNEDSTVEKSYPDHAYRDYLYLQRNGLVHHEIADVRTELRMVQKPVIK